VFAKKLANKKPVAVVTALREEEEGKPMETKQKKFTVRTKKAIVRQRLAGKTITSIAAQWFAAGKGHNRVRRVLAAAGLK